MEYSRRRLLQSGAVAVGSGILAGCSERPETTTSTGTREFRARRERGTAEELAVSESFDERYSYLADTDAVRQNTTTAAEPMPFSRWARLQCLTIGAGSVRERLTSRTDAGLMLVHGPPDEALALSVRVLTMRDDAGERVSSAGTAFESIVAATPRSVTTTVRLEGKTHRETIPVWVEANDEG